MLHLGVFDTGNAFAWAWFVVYFAVPVVLGAILLLQLHTPGRDPPPNQRLPTWLRAGLAVQVVVLLPPGVGLFVAPSTFEAVWQWELTPLLSRAVGAWLIGAATLKLQVVWEDDWRRSRAPFLTFLVWALLILVAVGRYRGTVGLDPHFGGFLLVVASVVGVGLYGTLVGWFGNGRADRSASGS